MLSLLRRRAPLPPPVDSGYKMPKGPGSRPAFSELFLAVADVYSWRAECRRRKNAAIFTIDNRIVAAGYNGSEPGQPSCLDGACPRGLLTYDEVASLTSYTEGRGQCGARHAEVNGIADAERRGISLVGATAYITSEPCQWCKDAMFSAGVGRAEWPGGVWRTTREYIEAPPSRSDLRRQRRRIAAAVRRARRIAQK